MLAAGRRRSRRSGGVVSTGGVVDLGAELCCRGCGAGTTADNIMPEKRVRFHADPEVIEIVDDGDDEFTFDNLNADGTPAVKQVSKARVGPPPFARSHIVDMILAHKRACDWVSGGLRQLPEARMIGHQGRRPYWVVDPEDTDDVPFELDMEILGVRASGRWDQISRSSVGGVLSHGRGTAQAGRWSRLQRGFGSCVL